MKFFGSIPAIVTPFLNGKLDLERFAALVEWQISEGSNGIVVCGTTGESPTLTDDEHRSLVAKAVAVAKGRIPIIAGTGSNSTHHAIAMTRTADEVGADGTLHATGYYNKPTQAQIIEHFRQIDAATKLPIIVYNIPSRTGIELSVDTLAALSEMKNIAGNKDSTGNVARVTQERLRIKKPFSFLSGDDLTSLGYVAHGGDGCVSVTANVAPKLCSQLMAASLAGDWKKARELQDRLMTLHAALFIEPSPGGIKYVMSKLGLVREELRSPIAPVSEAARRKLDEALEIANVSSKF